MRKGKKGFTLIELMIVIAIIAIIAAIAIPGLLSSQRASNERSASTSLKTLSTAEADFRSNDRDWNHVNDFWCFNVCGLYTMTNTAVAGHAGAQTTADPAIKLIELSVASADSGSLLVPTTTDYAGLSTFAVASPKAGYWHISLLADQSLAGTLEMTYCQDTDATTTYAMGSVHNTSKFGFLAFPDSQSAGKFVFIVNENNTIYRSATSSAVRPSATTPPGAISAPYSDWPSDTNLKSY